MTGLREPRADKPGAPRLIRRSPFWWAVSKGLVLAFTKVWFRMRVEGRANVPATGPVLLVANHASYIDPPLVGITAGRWVAFLAQAGLGKLGPLRWWLGQMGVTLIDRSAPSKDALRVIAESLSRGEAVGIFPEGTRSADGTVGPFRNGVEFLVRRTGACVVPIGLDGNHRAFPRKAWLPRPSKVVVRYGAPMSADEVLAPGGVERLRAKVAELARAPLRTPAPGEPPAPEGAVSGSPHRSDSTASTAPAAGGVGPVSSSPPSAGGGA